MCDIGDNFGDDHIQAMRELLEKKDPLAQVHAEIAKNSLKQMVLLLQLAKQGDWHPAHFNAQLVSLDKHLRVEQFGNDCWEKFYEPLLERRPGQLLFLTKRIIADLGLKLA